MFKPSQRFYVSLKAVIKNSDDHILLMQQQNGLWEFPGGRIDEGEESMPLESILRRELTEELGDQFQVRVGPMIHAWVVPYSDGVPGFIVEHECWYQSGEIVVSDEHIGYRWVRPDEWKALPLVKSEIDGYQTIFERAWDRSA